MASVLIIDDHQGTLDTFSAILRMAGFETATAATGRAGIELALARSFDVILVDLRLPDLPGTDVVRTLKRGAVQGCMVVVTAFPGLDTSFEAAAAGAAGYVEGPLFGNEVVDVVSQAYSGLTPVRHPAHRPDASLGVPSAPVSAMDARVREAIRILDAELDAVASVAMIAASCAILVAVFGPLRDSRAADSALPQNYTVGETLSGVGELPSGALVVLWLHSGCRYCEQSMQFYRRLSDEVGKARTFNARMFSIPPVPPVLAAASTRVNCVLPCPFPAAVATFRADGHECLSAVTGFDLGACKKA